MEMKKEERNERKAKEEEIMSRSNSYSRSDNKRK
jgi:hypothetical protein